MEARTPIPAQRASGAPRKRILLMDDDAGILQATGELLVALGFDVTRAADGQEAVEACESALRNGRTFHAAVLDMVVPHGMGGLECRKRLVALDPNLPVVASTGYANHPVASEPVAAGFAACLVKPYRVEELARVLGSILEVRRPTAN